MKVDWDELSLRYDCKDLGENTLQQFQQRITEVFPAILAERDAAQRLRDAVLHHFGTEGVKQWKNIADALAAFDRETQNEG